MSQKNLERHLMLACIAKLYDVNAHALNQILARFNMTLADVRVWTTKTGKRWAQIERYPWERT